MSTSKASSASYGAAEIDRIEAEAEKLLAERARRRRRAQGLGYVPHPLHPKQLAFLGLTAREALYGGAAGGAKTDALLAAALQYVHVPGYAALLLRRTYPSLALPNAIMDRSHHWLRVAPEVRWSADQRQWQFPSGAVLQFGFCDSKDDLERYQSSEYQFIGIDELTEWPEAWYRFLFSRLRRPIGLDVPLRFRAATNPGGVGAEWVRKQFAIPEDQIIEAPIGLGTETVFLPSRAEDNPSLDLEAYELSLSRLSAAKYAQLRWGRWVRDAEGLVYPGFSTRRNLIDRLPNDPTRAWHRYLALDFGITDRNALAVLAWRQHDPCTYVERCFAFRGGPSDFADVVKPIYDGGAERIIGDIGGMGKSFQAEFAKRHKLPVQAAKKNDKLGNVALINAALERAELVFVEAGCADYVAEVSVLPWSEGAEGKREADAYDNHCCDAVLYGWRASPSYLQQPPPAPKTELEKARDGVEAHFRRLQTARAAGDGGLGLDEKD